MRLNDATIDVLVVISACSVYVALETLHVPKRWSFLTMGLVLAAFTVYLAKRRTDSWHAFGFRADNLRAGLLPIGLFTLIAAAGIVGVGVWQGKTTWGSEALALLVLYPVWALAQQFAFQGVLHRRLMLLVRSPVLQVLITSMAFASVHFGNRPLFVLTFVAGIAWSFFYRRWPNLWLLAGSHSILAALAYPIILADAPLSRF